MSTLAQKIREAVATDPYLKHFDVAVQVSARRKYLGWSVESGGRCITIKVPATARAEAVIDMLANNEARIRQTVAKARRYAPPAPPVRFVDGQVFRWFGQDMRLTLTDGARPTERREDGDYGVRLLVPRADVVRRGALPVTEWYARQGTPWVVEEAKVWWPRMGSTLPAPSVRVAEMGRTRWGKYDGRRHAVTLAWQSMQFPADIIRYVLVHELAHATRPVGASHGPAFWRAFERARPNARQELWHLRQAESTAWRGEYEPLSAR